MPKSPALKQEIATMKARCETADAALSKLQTAGSRVAWCGHYQVRRRPDSGCGAARCGFGHAQIAFASVAFDASDSTSESGRFHVRTGADRVFGLWLDRW